MPAPKSPNTEAARAALAAKRAADKKQREIREARILLRAEGYLVLSKKNVIDLLASPICSGNDAIPGPYLRGFLHID